MATLFYMIVKGDNDGYYEIEGYKVFKLFVGVTTIAGGKSNVAGYRDGPSEDAKFSNDFDVVYIRPTCSLLVVDRGNAALRQISLNQDDCEQQYNSISPTGLKLPICLILTVPTSSLTLSCDFLLYGFVYCVGVSIRCSDWKL